MKKLRYRSEFAAAVEATASTGGQIMPPVMGAGRSSWRVYQYTVPEDRPGCRRSALLYYLGVMASVHFAARKDRLEKIPKN